MIDRALLAACELAGIPIRNPVLLREHGSSVYLLPHQGVIARLTRERTRASSMMAVVRWLLDNDIPATAPAIDRPIDVDGVIATFWIYYPQHGRPQPPGADLGAILRRLHALPPPPVALPDYRPLASFQQALDGSPNISEGDGQWLVAEGERLCAEYDQLTSHLGVGLIHGDAYPGNTLWGPDGALLGDWDEVARGPRELDLVNTSQGVRFGRTQAELDAFSTAYGWDARTWRGFDTLREIRDLHTLSAFIRLADVGDDSAANELRRRVTSLKTGDAEARWNSR